VTRQEADWARREAAVLEGIAELGQSGTRTFFKASQLYRVLGLTSATTVLPESAVRNQREVRVTLDRLEARGALVRARAGRGSRPTKHRIYVMPRADGGAG